ncbi:sarcosine oxidase subunit gamma [Denitrobaculum tricleocarpae]|uniref:Sarcosine oxidase subunit gamma n=1 Tax=Denitrobaculum tricleocarpae TaxID=2591009 RepID=A0A545TKB6_9PROT|nr:sarcosine oxidase subunit gamma family protein [Denitrobaculum tricleocarpae]TQV77672.1 sarcosine oxidase subunit gamma [Denitrobaculum tricleocarpae]
MVEAYLRQSPLSQLALPSRAAEETGDAGVLMAERPFRRIVNLRGDPKSEAFQNAAKSVLGAELPLTPNSTTSPNTAAASKDASLLWLGPDEWWAISEDETPPLADKLRDALTGQHAAVTDVGEGYSCIAVSGPNAIDTLAKGCTLDFHDSVFAPGSCAQSDMAKAAVVFRRLEDETPSFEIYVRSSFAEYLWRWIEDAAGEYGVAVSA